MTDKELNQAIQTYELKPGSYYLIEVKQHDVTAESLNLVSRMFEKKNIHIGFIMTKGSGFSLQAVPAVLTEKDD